MIRSCQVLYNCANTVFVVNFFKQLQLQQLINKWTWKYHILYSKSFARFSNNNEYYKKKHSQHFRLNFLFFFAILFITGTLFKVRYGGNSLISSRYRPPALYLREVVRFCPFRYNIFLAIFSYYFLSPILTVGLKFCDCRNKQ